MAVHKYQSGFGSSGAYLLPGRPWITGSADIGAGQETPKLRVHFNSTSSTDPAVKGNDGLYHGPGSADVITNMHFIQLDGDEESMVFNVRVKDVYITALNAGSGYQLYAELTGIQREEAPLLTGSGVTK